MGVLHVEDRVLVVLLQRQVHVEGEFGVGLATDQEKAHRVAAGPVDQVTQGDVGAGALGDFHLLATLHHRDHLVQHVIGVARRNADACRLQSSAHPGDGAVVVAPLDVDRLGVATGELADVVGHIGHEIGVLGAAEAAWLRLAHDPVLVVAIVGAAQPQRTVVLIRLARSHQPRDGGLDLPGLVQARLQKIVVEAHAEGLQVQVLLVAQVGHRKLADAVKVVDVARGGVRAVIGLDRLARGKIGGDVSDVVAVVGRLGPLRIAGLETAQARLC